MAEDPYVADLTAFLTDDGTGVLWSLAAANDLNLNLVRLEPGGGVGAHRNDAHDVVFVVVEGGGRLVADDVDHPLTPGVVALVPRGARRALEAGDDGLAYLTVHARPAPLSVEPPR